MTEIPAQLELLVSISRGRSGLARLREVIEAPSLKINASLEGLPPAMVWAAISLDKEIFGLLESYGGDREITIAKAEKVSMPNIGFEAASIGKQMAGGFLKKTLREVTRQVPALRRAGVDRLFGYSGPTRAQTLVRAAQRTREQEQEFIQTNLASFRKTFGVYLPDVTPFACAVLRKHSSVTDDLLEMGVNPNPVLAGKKLSDILVEQGRENLAKRLVALESGAM